MYGESNMETYITICKIDSQWEFAVCLRKLKQGLCINLEGWDGERGTREVQEGEDTCIPMADSCWGLTENKILYSNYPSIKNKLIKKRKFFIWVYSQNAYYINDVSNLFSFNMNLVKILQVKKKKKDAMAWKKKSQNVLNRNAGNRILYNSEKELTTPTLNKNKFAKLTVEWNKADMKVYIYCIISFL